MEIKQQLRLSQQLVMTPQLQQAIKLLQMSRLELSDMVREEMLENPILEDQRDQGEASTQSNDQGEQSASIESQIASDDRAIEEHLKVNERKTEDIDWERYLENHSLEGSPPSFRLASQSADDQPNAEATLSNTRDLSEHLTWQLGMGEWLEEEKRFATLVFGNLSDNGYLRIEDMSEEEIVPRLAEDAEIDPEDAEEVLKMLQRFDPIGVAARSLKECLYVQALHYGMDELVLKVIDGHLNDLERRNYDHIARALGIDVEEVYDITQSIMDLNPRPGRHYNTVASPYITPDVHVHRVGDDYFVVANDDGMPKLKISAFYRSAMVDDPQAKEYIQNKLRSAQWLIRSIDQRRKTIIKVTECIVEKQRDFFEKGIEHLKPMVLRDVADTVGMHESTISRVTNSKYVHTPRGIFELKFFFNSAIRRDNSDDIASESVKQAIRKIVDGENPKRPFSDQKIVEMLAQDGIVIARRTVAKYREMLGILSSSKRKKYF